MWRGRGRNFSDFIGFTKVGSRWEPNCAPPYIDPRVQRLGLVLIKDSPIWTSQNEKHATDMAFFERSFSSSVLVTVQKTVITMDLEMNDTTSSRPRTAKTMALEGPVDLDDDDIFDPSELTSCDDDKDQEQAHVLTNVRIVDLTPQTFFLQQKIAHQEKSLSLKDPDKNAACLPDWILGAPAWVQLLGFGGFVLSFSSIVFLAVYMLIDWENYMNAPASPQPAPTTPSFYGQPDEYCCHNDLLQRPTQSPVQQLSTTPMPTTIVSLEPSVAPSKSIVTNHLHNTGFPTFAPATLDPDA